MYYKYFGLSEAPFSIAPNPEFLFLTERHQEALAHLYHCLESDAGFVLLTGDIGTGKTTVCRRFLQKLPEKTQVAFILNPFLGGKELLLTIGKELKIPNIKENASLRELIESIYRHLLKNHSVGKDTILLIDEAQNIHPKVLELIRLLTNLETNQKKLLKIILVGQPELNDVLARADMEQLSQRITGRFHINPLSQREVSEYIHYRLRVAGFMGGEGVFSKSIINRIHELTSGVPRLINVICDRALLGVYSQNKHTVDKKTLEKAYQEVKGNNKKHYVIPSWLKWIVAAFVSIVLLGFAGQWAYRSFIHNNDFSEKEVVVEEVAIQQSNPEFYKNNIIEAVDRLRLYLGDNNIPPIIQCNDINYSGYRCTKRSLNDWQQLIELNRPVILFGRTYENNQALDLYGVLAELKGKEAVFFKNEEFLKKSLLSLEELWTGDIAFIWQVPPNFDGVIHYNSSKESINWLATSFAKLDNMPDPLAIDEFNQLLEDRVKIFQKNNGLIEDGVAGVDTVLKLTEQFGNTKLLNHTIKPVTSDE